MRTIHSSILRRAGPLAACLAMSVCGLGTARAHAPIQAGGQSDRVGGPVITNITGSRLPLYSIGPEGFNFGFLTANNSFFGPASGDPSYNGNWKLQSPGTAAYFSPFAGLANTENAQDPRDAGAARAEAFPSYLYGTAPIPRTSDTIDAKIDKDRQLVVTWSGEPRAVQSIRFALLDKSRIAIKDVTVTRLPATARLALTAKAAYLRVVVHYVNGTSTSVVSPLL